MSASNKFSIIIKEMANQLLELECPSNTLMYVSMMPNPPMLNLNVLRLHFVSKHDPGWFVLNNKVWEII